MSTSPSILSNLVMGAIAGGTIFLGLPIARWKNASEQLRGALALASAGVLIFLVIEVGYRAIEILESAAKAGSPVFLSEVGLFLAGLATGLVGLAWLEEKRASKRSTGATPLEIASMIAIGIGLHNFAEGLAIGQSFSSGASTFGAVLMIGFALHNATEGFGIAAPLAGQKARWLDLLFLGLIGGGPTALGAALGGVYTNQMLELTFLSVAVGSLIYVTRELLRLKFESLGPISAMSSLMLGLLLGISTELFVEVAMVKSGRPTDRAVASTKVTFDGQNVVPATTSIARGQTLAIENKGDIPLEFEGTGLFAGEAMVPAKQTSSVQIIGQEGRYSLSDEFGKTGNAVVEVTAAKSGVDASIPSDAMQIVAALTTLEGHARAARDLHERVLSGHSPNAAADIKRAGKHAGHPLHELFEAKDPNALMIQKQLTDAQMLVPLKDELEKYIKLAGDKSVSVKDLYSEFAKVLSLTERARRAVGGKAYDTEKFRDQSAWLVMKIALGEYSGAVHTGKIVVEELGKPGKDGVLEYQDARGFFNATKNMMGLYYESSLTAEQQQTFSQILTDFQPIDPPMDSPLPADHVRELVDKVIEGR